MYKGSVPGSTYLYLAHFLLSIFIQDDHFVAHTSDFEHVSYYVQTYLSNKQYCFTQVIFAYNLSSNSNL